MGRQPATKGDIRYWYEDFVKSGQLSLKRGLPDLAVSFFTAASEFSKRVVKSRKRSVLTFEDVGDIADQIQDSIEPKELCRDIEDEIMAKELVDFGKGIDKVNSEIAALGGFETIRTEFGEATSQGLRTSMAELTDSLARLLRGPLP